MFCGKIVYARKESQMAKIAFIECTLPELRGGKMYQTGKGEGANAKAAISRAFGEIFKKVKGKRISVITARITLTTKAESEVEPTEVQ
jgi:hypothetical protein